MLVIRFNRTGRRNAPLFRLVVQEKAVAPGGRHVEVVGSWNPHKKEGIFKNDRILYWIEKGAQPSDSVHNLLVSQGVTEGKKRSIKMEKPKAPEPTTEENKESAEQETSKEEAKESSENSEKKQEAEKGEKVEKEAQEGDEKKKSEKK